jgi:hypothetical protein
VTMPLILAVESVIPADHPVAILAIPLGLVFLSGSVYMLLWSNYGAKKAAAIYGTAFFGFNLLLGVFWWFGGPGIPTSLGITHLPGQPSNQYAEVWYPFEAGSERAAFFPSTNNAAEFVPLADYLGKQDLDEAALSTDPMFAAVSGSLGQAVDSMSGQFLPIDGNGVAQIGGLRRQGYEDDVARATPREAAGRATPFFTAEPVGEPRVFDDQATGVRVATQRFQVVANFVDAAGTPLAPVPVGEEVDWFAFFDPGATTFPSALWTIVSLVLFLLSLAWLDRMEMREKSLAMDLVETPEDLAVPIAQ